jgi:hypothetical protein
MLNNFARSQPLTELPGDCLYSQHYECLHVTGSENGTYTPEPAIHFAFSLSILFISEVPPEVAVNISEADTVRVPVRSYRMRKTPFTFHPPGCSDLPHLTIKDCLRRISQASAEHSKVIVELAVDLQPGPG